ncbi:TetR/AcrR family transcriptional regulator [Agilicoccus flavus]|uniref:TetR/AcrR family transcriptional regulator n=1 Tax=Agilicoccus flavus TaxID=2775968 RepID=UPI001CF71992|nr:TetR/AcrR family transcriptional regulator [Agilicoccus flavus]
MTRNTAATTAPTEGRVGRVWRGMPPEQRDNQRRLRLLDAGLETFGTIGYPASTVSGLCTAAGVSTRSFYELFSGRAALLEAVYLGICEDLLERIATAHDVAGRGGCLDDPRAWVRTALTHVVGPLLEDVRVIRVLEVEMVGVDCSLEATRRGMTHRVAEALTDLFDDAIGSRNKLLGVFVEGGMSEALLAYAEDELTSGAPEVVDGLADIVVRLLWPLNR